MEKTRSNTANGQRKKNLFRKRGDLINDVYGKGDAFTVPSVRKPDSLRARCQAPTEPISSATNAGDLPVVVSTKRSEPCSSSFCIHTGEPLTKAQCKAVKPCLSVTLTLAPHCRKRSTHAEYPLYAAHISDVCPCRSGSSMGIF